MSEDLSYEISGVEYRVFVTYGENTRTVKVMAPAQDTLRNRASDSDEFLIFYARDRRTSPLPDLQVHVKDALNEAIDAYQVVEERNEERLDKIKNAVKEVSQKYESDE